MASNYGSIAKSRTWTIRESGVTANEVIEINAADAVIVAMDFTKVLGDDSRLATITDISSSPTTTESDSEIAINGKIVSWKVASLSSGTTYTYTAKMATGASPAETINGVGRLVVA